MKTCISRAVTEHQFLSYISTVEEIKQTEIINQSTNKKQNQNNPPKTNKTKQNAMNITSEENGESRAFQTYEIICLSPFGYM